MRDTLTLRDSTLPVTSRPFTTLTAHTGRFTDMEDSCSCDESNDIIEKNTKKILRRSFITTPMSFGGSLKHSSQQKQRINKVPAVFKS